MNSLRPRHSEPWGLSLPDPHSASPRLSLRLPKLRQGAESLTADGQFGDLTWHLPLSSGLQPRPKQASEANRFETIN